ncbi:MAG: DUF3881 family protein [Lachnospiraceae bacterium]|nr:DUF3881 family protein [Lachnospiraceae bacterium]
MHSFLRSIGFRDVTREQFRSIIEEIKLHPDYEQVSMDVEGNQYVELKKLVAKDMGIAMRGTYDQNDHFQMDYYYPYLIGHNVSLENNIDVIRLSDKDCYQGIVDDPRLGIDLIFFLQDIVGDSRIHSGDDKRIKDGKVKLSALASSGKILLPKKEPVIRDKDAWRKKTWDRIQLIDAALRGDMEAMEKFEVQDAANFERIVRRLKIEDILTVVNSYIMPNGIECDKYSILGDIISYRNYVNRETMEMVHCLTVRSNAIILDVVINEKDLLGEPVVGRRFKGDVWFQGKLKGHFKER